MASGDVDASLVWLSPWVAAANPGIDVSLQPEAEPELEPEDEPEPEPEAWVRAIDALRLGGLEGGASSLLPKPEAEVARGSAPPPSASGNKRPPLGKPLRLRLKRWEQSALSAQSARVRARRAVADRLVLASTCAHGGPDLVRTFIRSPDENFLKNINKYSIRERPRHHT